MPTILKFDLCKICWRMLCVYVEILSISVCQLDVTGDTLPGLVIVVNSTSSCPSTAEKWNARAEKINCESMLSTVNVTLKYHCLVNHWGNESVELCGEESEIIGHSCPEFNQGGNRIQEKYKHKCNHSDPPCPFKFYASEVFKCKICWRILCVYVVILSLSVRQLDVTGDTLPGLVIVVNSTSSCPSTAEKWNARAEKINCESMLSTVNVTLKYHCLVNHWGNESVELCGEESEIIGHSCPEFNQGGNRIQEKYKHKCNHSDPPYPFKCYASEVFKYPSCLKLTIPIGDDNDDDVDLKTDTGETDGVPIITITILVFLAILIISLLYFYLKRKKNKPKEIKHTTEEVKNATACNNEMYGEKNDPSTILKDEQMTMIKFPK